MPIKPTQDTILAEQARKANPNFAHDALEAIVNETPQLAQALLDAGLVTEAKE